MRPETGSNAVESSATDGASSVSESTPAVADSAVPPSAQEVSGDRFQRLRDAIGSVAQKVGEWTHRRGDSAKPAAVEEDGVTQSELTGLKGALTGILSGLTIARAGIVEAFEAARSKIQSRTTSELPNEEVTETEAQEESGQSVSDRDSKRMSGLAPHFSAAKGMVEKFGERKSESNEPVVANASVESEAEISESSPSAEASTSRFDSAITAMRDGLSQAKEGAGRAFKDAKTKGGLAGGMLSEAVGHTLSAFKIELVKVEKSLEKELESLKSRIVRRPHITSAIGNVTEGGIKGVEDVIVLDEDQKSVRDKFEAISAAIGEDGKVEEKEIREKIKEAKTPERTTLQIFASAVEAVLDSDVKDEDKKSEALQNLRTNFKFLGDETVIADKADKKKALEKVFEATALFMVSQDVAEPLKQAVEEAVREPFQAVLSQAALSSRSEVQHTSSPAAVEGSEPEVESAKKSRVSQTPHNQNDNDIVAKQTLMVGAKGASAIIMALTIPGIGWAVALGFLYATRNVGDRTLEPPEGKIPPELEEAMGYANEWKKYMPEKTPAMAVGDAERSAVPTTHAGMAAASAASGMATEVSTLAAAAEAAQETVRRGVADISAAPPSPSVVAEPSVATAQSQATSSQMPDAVSVSVPIPAVSALDSASVDAPSVSAPDNPSAVQSAEPSVEHSASAAEASVIVSDEAIGEGHSVGAAISTEGQPAAREVLSGESQPVVSTAVVGSLEGMSEVIGNLRNKLSVDGEAAATAVLHSEGHAVGDEGRG